jgi:hypothetical protein
MTPLFARISKDGQWVLCGMCRHAGHSYECGERLGWLSTMPYFVDPETYQGDLPIVEGFLPEEVPHPTTGRVLKGKVHIVEATTIALSPGYTLHDGVWKPSRRILESERRDNRIACGGRGDQREVERARRRLRFGRSRTWARSITTPRVSSRLSEMMGSRALKGDPVPHAPLPCLVECTAGHVSRVELSLVLDTTRDSL